MSWARLQGASLAEANLSGAVLRCSFLRGTNLEGADLRGADLTSDLIAAESLGYAILAGARYDAGTRWPEGFDPQRHGAVKIA